MIIALPRDIINSVITGMFAIITWANPISPSAILTANNGINSKNPLRPLTNTANPAAPDAASAAKPVDSNRRPPPRASDPIPNNAIAPLSPNSTGTTGASNKPATPRTVNTPAIANKPTPIVDSGILPNFSNTPASIFNATVTTTNETAPLTEPLSIVVAIPTIRSDPAKVSNPLPICARFILPISSTALASLTNCPSNIETPKLLAKVPLGNNLIANEIRVNAPAIDIKPFAI